MLYDPLQSTVKPVNGDNGENKPHPAVTGASGLLTKPASRPNLVYVLADDMGYGDVSCLNEGAAFRTVHIDRLAAQGLRCTDAHASSAVCTPSRYSLLTGRYNWRSVLKQGVTGGYSQPILERGRLTVASMLRDQGYRTACVGKWHLGLGWRLKDGGPASTCQDEDRVDFAAPLADSPLNHGFDYFFGISASLDMPPYVYIENDRPTSVPTRRMEATAGKVFMRAGLIGDDFRPEDVLPTLTAKVEDLVARYARGGDPFFTVCLADLTATMAEITGYALPDTAGEDSVSNLPLWNGSATGPVREATVHHSINGSFSIRKGMWKLELCPGSGGWSPPKPNSPEAAALPPIQLYDLSKDIGERQNVQDRHPDMVEDLKGLLTRYVREGRSTPGAPQANTGSKHWPQLHWLVDIWKLETMPSVNPRVLDDYWGARRKAPGRPAAPGTGPGERRRERVPDGRPGRADSAWRRSLGKCITW